MASILLFVLMHVKKNHPLVNVMFMQSDNATCFSSQEHVPYIYHKNKEWTVGLSIMISLWIFTESGTGKVRLDTHYSLLNIFLKSFIEDGHDITTEEDIFKAFK